MAAHTAQNHGIAARIIGPMMITVALGGMYFWSMRAAESIAGLAALISRIVP